MNTYKDTHNVNNRKTFFSNPDCYIDYEIIASGFQQARRKASMETARLDAFFFWPKILYLYTLII